MQNTKQNTGAFLKVFNDGIESDESSVIFSLIPVRPTVEDGVMWRKLDYTKSYTHTHSLGHVHQRAGGGSSRCLCIRLYEQELKCFSPRRHVRYGSRANAFVPQETAAALSLILGVHIIRTIHSSNGPLIVEGPPVIL